MSQDMKKRTSFLRDLQTNLKKIGIKKGDTVYLGIDLGQTFKFYHNEILPNNSLNKVKKNCSNLILKTILELIGPNGTIICPTFSFSFIKSKIFDVKNTKCDLGYFENYFLNQKNIIRSKHPISPARKYLSSQRLAMRSITASPIS